MQWYRIRIHLFTPNKAPLWNFILWPAMTDWQQFGFWCSRANCYRRKFTDPTTRPAVSAFRKVFHLADRKRCYRGLWTSLINSSGYIPYHKETQAAATTQSTPTRISHVLFRALRYRCQRGPRHARRIWFSINLVSIWQSWGNRRGENRKKLERISCRSHSSSSTAQQQHSR